MSGAKCSNIFGDYCKSMKREIALFMYDEWFTAVK